jgi:hypothetical protein
MAWTGSRRAADIGARRGRRGYRVVVTYGLAAVLKTRFLEGAPADVLILTAPIIDDLSKQGKVVYSREGASGDQVSAKDKDTGTKAGEMLAAGEIAQDFAAARALIDFLAG